ncbi:hypothetical protein CBL_07114 [Carabus blaptoides fortunei]
MWDNNPSLRRECSATTLDISGFHLHLSLASLLGTIMSLAHARDVWYRTRIPISRDINQQPNRDHGEVEMRIPGILSITQRCNVIKTRRLISMFIYTFSSSSSVYVHPFTGEESKPWHCFEQNYMANHGNINCSTYRLPFRSTMERRGFTTKGDVMVLLSAGAGTMRSSEQTQN